MSLFDEAAAFMKNRPSEVREENTRDELIKKIQSEFENATKNEIERALDKLSEKGELPTDFRELMKKIRIWLED